MNKYIVANLKMNMTALEVNNYLKVINDKVDSNNVIICPTSIYVPYFLKQNYKVGLQNVFYESKGAYTGEISPLQASSMGIRYVLIGHSERRIHFEESDLVINKKIREALDNHLKVIICIGETEEEKDMLKTDRVLRNQIGYALKNVDKIDYKNIMFAYEPVWSIGTGNIPTIRDITTTICYIRKILLNHYEWPNPLILYGGSVNEKNISALNEIDVLNGFLIGGASNNPERFLEIIERVLNGR